MDIDWDNLPVHPALAALPTLDAEGVAALAADIKKNGLSVPIILWQDNRDARPGPEGASDGTVYLIDGRARLAALRLNGVTDPETARCSTALKGIKPVRYTRAVINATPLGGGKVNVIEDTVAEQVAWSMNGERLHSVLTQAQRREAVIACCRANPNLSTRRVGAIFGLHNTTVGKILKGAQAVENSTVAQSPVDRALEAIIAQPTATNRQIAKQIKVAPNTVGNARKRSAQEDALAQAEKIIASAMITMDPLDAPLKQVMLTIRKYVRRAGERGPDLIQRLMVELASYDHEAD